MQNAGNDLTETISELNQDPERRYDIWRADSPSNDRDNAYVPTCEDLENRIERNEHACSCDASSTCCCERKQNGLANDVDFIEQRMRGGCGGCTGCAAGTNFDNDPYRVPAEQRAECCGSHRDADFQNKVCASSRGFAREASDREGTQQLMHYQPGCSGRTSSPCASKRRCCPPAGQRGMCRKTARCRSPCTAADTLSCGGGGCCGSGCRGGCGKPGQVCMPARPCTMPPCMPHTPASASPCAPPRPCAPQPPCCRTPRGSASPARTMESHARGRGSCGGSRAGSSSCCRSYSPRRGNQEDCCQSKVPPGCECLGGGLDCQRCGRKVYQAEMQIASGVPYHNICFSCFCCRKPLEPLTYQENCGEIYCKQCYVRNFGPQGYGYGIGAGVLQTPM